jgi:hypothetical protein
VIQYIQRCGGSGLVHETRQTHRLASWVVQSASAWPANDALRRVHEGVGLNDVTVSNRVNLVDPFLSRDRLARETTLTMM